MDDHEGMGEFDIFQQQEKLFEKLAQQPRVMDTLFQLDCIIEALNDYVVRQLTEANEEVLSDARIEKVNKARAVLSQVPPFLRGRATIASKAGESPGDRFRGFRRTDDEMGG